MHSQAPAFAMHPLNAPVRPGSNIVGGRVIQKEKRVTIHGLGTLRAPHLAD
jgi:hypothetical protein